MSIICPIHKKGDKLKCENHRGISLLSTAYKLLTTILKERLECFSEEILGDYQAGFRRNRSTSDQLFTVRQILTKCWEFDVDIYQLFVDFKQAYDSINREKLYRILLTFDIPAKLVKLIKATMNNTKCRVRIGGQLTDEFMVSQGLKQGDALAPTLFNLSLEYVIRETYQNNTNSNIYFQSSQIIGYADDLNIVGRSLTALQEVFEPLETAAKRIGLSINEDKTKIMKQSRSQRNDPRQNISFKDTYNFEVVNEFAYLGSTITKENEDHVEIKRRIATGNRTFFSLLPMLKSRNVHRKTKITLYKTIIRTVVTYGCEAWTMTAKSAEMLDTFERRVLRKILGPVNDGEAWRIRFNEELYNIYKAPRLSVHARLSRLRWAGHLQRMPSSRATRRILEGHPGGRRRVGRPRLRWEDEVRKDAAQLLQVTDWRTAAEDRRSWRRCLQEAKARFEL
jgi:sorting nexin-29